MNTFFRRSLYLLAFAFISGCASSAYSVKGNYSFTEGKDEGLIVFSTRLDFTCPPVSVLIHKPATGNLYFTDGDSNKSVLIVNKFVKSTYESHQGYFYVKALKTRRLYI